MSFEVTGKLVEVYPVTAVSEKFKKREFVIERTESKNSFDMTDYLKFQLVQDKCGLADLYKTGDTIKVSFNLRGRKWEKNGVISYFTNLEAWKIEKIGGQTTAPAEPANDPGSFPEDDFSSPVKDSDDLPF